MELPSSWKDLLTASLSTRPALEGQTRERHRSSDHPNDTERHLAYKPSDPGTDNMYKRSFEFALVMK